MTDESLRFIWQCRAEMFRCKMRMRGQSIQLIVKLRELQTLIDEIKEMRRMAEDHRNYYTFFATRYPDQFKILWDNVYDRQRDVLSDGNV